MTNFRYTLDGNWYKGNIHIHSTASDGGKGFTELAEMYANAGYDFLFRTDHWVVSDVQSDPESYPLLWLDGIELDGYDHGGSHYHVVCLGHFSGLEREMGLVAAMEEARAQEGLLILAHPQWMANSFEDALRWGFHGVEVYNHVCRWNNGKSEGGAYWNVMLERFPNTLAFAVDDAHIRPKFPTWDGGWITVNVPHLSREALYEAIHAGNFYASCGPEIHTLAYDGKYLTVQSSPIQYARLAGPGHWGKRVGSLKGTFSETTLKLPHDWPYVYLEIEDTQGRRAWTNPLFNASH